jgi:hypothetical protein
MHVASHVVSGSNFYAKECDVGGKMVRKCLANTFFFFLLLLLFLFIF